MRLRRERPVFAHDPRESDEFELIERRVIEKDAVVSGQALEVLLAHAHVFGSCIGFDEGCPKRSVVQAKLTILWALIFWSLRGVQQSRESGEELGSKTL